MASRATGWIQDPGELENLIKVIELFDRKTNTHKNLLLNLIPNKILVKDGRLDLIAELSSRNGYKDNPKISYRGLIGSAFKPRSSARCNGIVQALIKGQRRNFISDWPANNFIRWGETLGFIKYYREDDSYSITDIGLKFTENTNLNKKYDILKEVLLQYPPVIRILELLYDSYCKNPQDPSLTKFELGKELGFRGEDGFTTYPQHLVIQAIVISPKQKNNILTNWEGSSDKYARMICGWLSHKQINWIKQSTKSVLINIDNRNIKTDIPQSYSITVDGVSSYRKSRARSWHKKIPKRVFFEMLATKGTDKDYLRTRRALIIKYLKRWRTIHEVQIFSKKNQFSNIYSNVIQDDVNNFKRIGLNIIQNSQNQFKIIDSIIGLCIPKLSVPQLIPSYITLTKLRLSNRINYVDHSYFDLIDLGFDSRQNRLYELRIVELLNLMDSVRALHLAGGNKPEIIAYSPSENPINAVIMDSKSYKNGFNIPNSERDKMIRYINECKQKDNKLNSNRWWENFKKLNYPVNPVIYNFVSGNFIGQFLNQIQYILTQTGTNGGAITSEKLIDKVEAVINPNISYSVKEFFNDLACNGLVK